MITEKLKLKQPVKDSHPELPLDPDAPKPGAYKWPPLLTPYLMMWVFAGGYLGTSARYSVAFAFPYVSGSWPIATFLVNLIGSFLLGLLLEALANSRIKEGRRNALRLGVGTGFIGAFTTYSALAVEVDMFVHNGQPVAALLYAAASLTGGVVCSFIGIQTAAMRRKHRKVEQA
jgi:CrcB protein